MSRGFTIADDSSFRRMEDAVNWAHRQMQRREMDYDIAELPLVSVMVTNNVPDSEGMFSGIFVYRRTDVTPHRWCEVESDATCKIDPGYLEDPQVGTGSCGTGSLVGIGSIPNVVLEIGRVYAAYVTEVRDGVVIALIVGSAVGGGDRIEVGEIYDDGTEPPNSNYLGTRVVYWRPATDTTEYGQLVWLKDMTNG